MSVDTYSICPCGNGKKIKFCKCKDSIHDMDRVIKMVEGGQVVPALDRLAAILEEHPDAAWALAIRGRLLIDLREYDTLAENAERFMRLQPSNPLALTQRAAAKLFSGDVESATGSMLDALTESGREVDSFVISVASVLSYTLLQTGAFLTARAYATLAVMAEGFEGQNAAMDVLGQLNHAPTIPMLLKSLPEPISRPSTVDWGERFDEAQGLLRSNKVVLAETKLQSLQRVASMEPAILSGLLHCAIWRGNLERQSDLLRQLSQCESLDQQQRVRFAAMAELVHPDLKGISVSLTRLEATIGDLDEIEMAFLADSRVLKLPAEAAQSLRQEDEEVAPRVAFQILDRDRPEPTEAPSVDNFPRSLAIVLLYGKQTDRDAKLIALDMQSADAETVQSKLSELLPGVEYQSTQDRQLPFLVAARPQLALVQFEADPLAVDETIVSIQRSEVADRLTKIALPMLGDRSLVDAAQDSDAKFDCSVAVTIMESYDLLTSLDEELSGKIRSAANVDALPGLTISDDDIEDVANVDLNRVDVAGLNNESRIYLMNRAQQVSATPLLRRVAQSILDSNIRNENPDVTIMAYFALVGSSTNFKSKLALLDEAKSYAKANDRVTPRMLFLELELRLQARDGEGFQQSLREVSETYGNNPEVMAQLQQMLMSWGLIRPDGSPRNAGPAAAAPASPQAESGLWTPDSGSPAAAPPAASGPPASAPESGGGGKLWVPGMD
ncbi:tetratricopeptide repeat protein [Crateriforma conspicua]|uniref:SEC-C motif protein n=1 Tax=Crateriforma conspicua TaxID=2527996 RepID=A0A5C5Y6Z1_9PLAN|nr:hypothetical protein [Crateriforma conspicua]TWT70055.1 hypothetical protein Pan14r_23530 [Crateriforma conspicua]